MAHSPSTVDQQCGAQQFCRRIWALQRLMDNLSCSICLDSQLVANSCNGHCCLQPHHSLLQCSSQHLLPFEAIRSTTSHRARTSISPHASLEPITRPMQPQSTKHARDAQRTYTLYRTRALLYFKYFTKRSLSAIKWRPTGILTNQMQPRGPSPLPNWFVNTGNPTGCSGGLVLGTSTTVTTRGL